MDACWYLLGGTCTETWPLSVISFCFSFNNVTCMKWLLLQTVKRVCNWSCTSHKFILKHLNLSVVTGLMSRYHLRDCVCFQLTRNISVVKMIGWCELQRSSWSCATTFCATSTARGNCMVTVLRGLSAGITERRWFLMKCSSTMQTSSVCRWLSYRTLCEASL